MDFRQARLLAGVFIACSRASTGTNEFSGQCGNNGYLSNIPLHTLSVNLYPKLRECEFMHTNGFKRKRQCVRCSSSNIEVKKRTRRIEKNLTNQCYENVTDESLRRHRQALNIFNFLAFLIWIHHTVAFRF